HYPTTITDPSTVTPFLRFEPNAEFPQETVGGVIKNWPDGRQEIDFFIAGTTASLTTAYLGHVWFQWGNRGLYSGFRRVYFSTQIDDFFLTTTLHDVSPNPPG